MSEGGTYEFIHSRLSLSARDKIILCVSAVTSTMFPEVCETVKKSGMITNTVFVQDIVAFFIHTTANDTSRVSLTVLAIHSAENTPIIL